MINKPFTVRTCTKEDFILRCRERNISNDSCNIGLAYFIEKSKSISDLAEEYNIDCESMNKRIWRIKKQLEQ